MLLKLLEGLKSDIANNTILTDTMSRKSHALACGMN